MQNTENSIIKYTRKANDTLVVIAFGLLACIVMLQVICRYVFNSPLSWSEEAARYLQVWMVMLGGAVCFRYGSHLAIDILTSFAPPKIRRILNIIVYVLIVIFLCIVTFYGINLVKLTSGQTSPAMQMPMSLAYLAFPVGGGLMLIEAIIFLTKTIRNEEVSKQQL